ncbi:MAG: MlrC family protein 3, partial [Proteobacteria bacterium]|nr:MlrC family protein 3 [Pseudomonadota bacterium]
MSTNKPRIALIGFNLESNRWAPVVGRTAFEADLYLRSDEILSDARSPNPRAQATMAGFVATMDKTGPWEPLPIVSTSGG